MKTKIFSILCTALILSSGCSKSLLDTKNENTYNASTYFKTQKEFNEAIIACYAVFNHGGMMSREWYFNFDLMSNDASPVAALVGVELALWDYSYSNSNEDLVFMWASLYRMIFRANLALKVMEKWVPKGAEEEALKKQYVAEAHWFRGFGYYYLVNCWGRVPLKMDFDASLRNAEPRANAADVWKIVEDEFTAAIDGLPVEYDDANTGRATKGAAIAFLGKALLTQKKYGPAAVQFEKLTKAPFTYQLDPSFDHLFSDDNHNSPEIVFAVNHKYTSPNTQYYMFQGWEGDDGKTAHTGRAQEYGFNDWYNVSVSSTQVAAFKYANPVNGTPYIDPRAAYTYYGPAGSGGDIDVCDHCSSGPQLYEDLEIWEDVPHPLPTTWRKYEPYEFQEKTEAPMSEINTHVVRFADVKLMLAECYIEQGLKLTEAVGLINDVRNRPSVMAVNYPALNQTNARTALRRERQIEFAGEQSRWFDLRRWGIAKETMNTENPPRPGKHPFEDKHLLLPIPLGERQTNQALASDVANDWN
ncbi:RagB/SusD family nutrient uptake outer membrane protein [Pseudoflavitalea sp. G-6-1-2]|uniref:RagB/SusD family nutrient uptake outer membrane protein n=1 Tax=Pseudoflavitalea sp. G-6-1-2 TaxID=2728841 RepID=UPI00146C2B77|nr:RagB/SusD family nutrient uptake outer membrane protein [Pseudoflavitalea sp. G-6-1-2]NML23117.1 RagB/SusD family nutrient uptake outer membrane protein [Pseudoflavitalea sp. G-6-1-2]